jgi:hypothetical protein
MSAYLCRKYPKVLSAAGRLDEIMDTAQAVDHVEFGLSLMRLSRAVSGQQPADAFESAQVLKEKALAPQRKVAS